jgi:hypothetical protein
VLSHKNRKTTFGNQAQYQEGTSGPQPLQLQFFEKVSAQEAVKEV